VTVHVNPTWGKKKNGPGNRNLGIEYRANRIVHVAPRSQAAKLGIRVGFIIIGFSGVALIEKDAKDAKVIHGKLKSKLIGSLPFTIEFAYRWDIAVRAYQPGLYKSTRPIYYCCFELRIQKSDQCKVPYYLSNSI